MKKLMCMFILGAMLNGCAYFKDPKKIDDSHTLKPAAWIGDDVYHAVPDVGTIIEGESDVDVPLGVFAEPVKGVGE